MEIYENVLTKEDYIICSNIIDNNNWKYSGSSGENNVPTKFWYMELKHIPFFYKFFLNRIEEITKKKFKLNRLYANGQTFGLDGGFHIDDSDENSYTFLYYYNDYFDENNKSYEHLGYTQFKLKDNIINIEPIFNRGILFKSNILHRGLAPSRYFQELRITIAFKLLLI